MSGVEYAMQKYNAWLLEYSNAVESQPTFYGRNESMILFYIPAHIQICTLCHTHTATPTYTHTHS